MGKKKSEFGIYFRHMFMKAKGFNRFLPLILLCSIVFMAVSIFIAILSKQLIDNLLTLNTHVITRAILISIIAYLLGALLGFLTSYMQKYVVDKIKMQIQLGFYDNMQRSKFIFFSNLSSSDVYYRMFTDIGILVDFYLCILISMPVEIVVLCGATILMSMWSWQLTIAIIGLVLLQLIVTMIFKNPIKKYAARSIESEQTLITKINEDVLRSDLIRSLSLEKVNRNNIESYFDVSRKNKLKSSKINLLFNTIIGVVNQIINICLLLLGVYFVSAGNLTIGGLMGISMLAGYIYQPINDLFNAVISYQPTQISFKRYIEFYNAIDYTLSKGTKEFMIDDIYLENVCFNYGNRNVINNLNMKIQQGKITLITGGNGIGKTTLIRLLSRFISPSSGEIKIGKINLHDFDYESYRNNVIPMGTEPILLNATFKENITCWQEYSDEEVYKIVKQCCLEEVVASLESGYDTMLGLGHSGLSQGEIQKLSLARILIRHPQILLLDEPTSHIDVNSAREILQTLKSVNDHNKVAIVIVSHDDRVNAIADYIIELA